MTMTFSLQDLVDRRRTLNASEVAAVMGISPYQNAFDIYAEKVSEDPPKQQDSWAMMRGRLVEPALLGWLADKRAPHIIQRNTRSRLHPIHTWLAATPDAEEFDASGGGPLAVAEAKSSGHWAAWEDEDGEHVVPDEHMVQLETQMLVRGVTRGIIVAEVLGDSRAKVHGDPEPRVYEVESDPEVRTLLLETCWEFWHNHVLKREPPPLGENPRMADVRTIYRKVKHANLLPASAYQGVEEAGAHYMLVRKELKLLEAQKEALQARICAAIGDREGFFGPGWRVTWKERAGYMVPARVVEPGRHFDIREVKPKEAKGKKAA